MIKLILGLILLNIPFLFIYRFRNKIKGFAYILTLVIFLQLIIAILTQMFHIFSYNVILGVNLIIALIFLFKADYLRLTRSLRRIKIDWVLILVIFISFASLYGVHYNYTGTITNIDGSFSEVENYKYPYPYFSDEWSAVAAIKRSISTHSLPLQNAFIQSYRFFPNLVFPFHSFTSEIFLLLGLDPVTQYTILTLFTGILIIVLIYLILRANNVGKLVAGISSLSLLYVVNGSNLPGIWTFIPLIMGIICMLIGFLFITYNNKKMALILSFLVLLFYPPLFVIHAFSISFFFIFSKGHWKSKLNHGFIYIIIGLIVLLLLLGIYSFRGIGLNEIIIYISNKIYYQTFTKNAIPDFSIWKVIPIPILLLSLFGFKNIKKRSWLIAPIFVGLAYWILYSRVLWRFIIDYERVVVSTSILIVVLSGFGLNYLVNYFKKLETFRKNRIIEIFLIIVLILFFIGSFSYTERDNWNKLNLRGFNGEEFITAAPANAYLHEDDLKFFNFTRRAFISDPWKGTVIGASTGNFPFNTKSATLTNSKSYYEFMALNCEEKRNFSEKWLGHVYSQKFDCEGFELKGVSSEGFHFYEVSSWF